MVYLNKGNMTSLVEVMTLFPLSGLKKLLAKKKGIHKFITTGFSNTQLTQKLLSEVITDVDRFSPSKLTWQKTIPTVETRSSLIEEVSTTQPS